MKVVQNGSTRTDTISTCLSDVSNTANMEPSPSDNLTGTQPVLMSQPRINSCSEQITEHCVRASLLCIYYVIHLCCYYCCVFIVSPHFYSLIDPVAAADGTVSEYDYLVDDRTPTVELPGKQTI